jgi:hypothetical protein
MVQRMQRHLAEHFEFLRVITDDEDDVDDGYNFDEPLRELKISASQMLEGDPTRRWHQND